MDIDPDKLTPAQLEVIAQHLIEKALGNNPEARRRLEDLKKISALTTGWACSFGSPNNWAPSTRQLTRRVRSIILLSAPITRTQC
jgi:hypothetical protein